MSELLPCTFPPLRSPWVSVHLDGSINTVSLTHYDYTYTHSTSTVVVVDYFLLSLLLPIYTVHYDPSVGIESIGKWSRT